MFLFLRAQFLKRKDMTPTTSSRSLDFRGFSDLLNQCILHAEKSVQRINFNNIRLRLFGYCLAEDGVQVELRPRILPALRPEAACSGCHKPGNFLANLLSYFIILLLSYCLIIIYGLNFANNISFY